MLQQLSSWPLEAYQAGETVLAGGTTTGKLLVMIEGVVEVVRDGTRIAEVAEPGAVFGELGCCSISRTPPMCRAGAFDLPRGGRADHPARRCHDHRPVNVRHLEAQRLTTVNRHLVEVRARMARTDQRRRLVRGNARQHRARPALRPAVLSATLGVGGCAGMGLALSIRPGSARSPAAQPRRRQCARARPEPRRRCGRSF